MSLKYDVVVRKSDNAYCVFIPELSLFVEASTVSEAYEKLEEKKAQHFKGLIAIEAINTVREPLSVAIKNRFQEDMLLFASKTLVVSVIFGIIASLFLPVVDVFVSTRLDPMLSVGAMVRRVDKKLSNMSQKDQEEKLDTLRRMLLNVKPFAKELRVLFEDDSKRMNRSIPENEKPKKTGEMSPSAGSKKNFYQGKFTCRKF